MKEHVLYQGRMVPKQGFRAFVYSFDNKSRVANSWEEYEKLVASGTWFATREKALEKPRRKKERD